MIVPASLRTKNALSGDAFSPFHFRNTGSGAPRKQRRWPSRYFVPKQCSGPGEQPRQPDHARAPEAAKGAEHQKAADSAKS